MNDIDGVRSAVERQLIELRRGGGGMTEYDSVMDHAEIVMLNAQLKVTREELAKDKAELEGERKARRFAEDRFAALSDKLDALMVAIRKPEKPEPDMEAHHAKMVAAVTEAVKSIKMPVPYPPLPNTVYDGFEIQRDGTGKIAGLKAKVRNG